MKKKKILDGHKKVGSKFIPPAKHLMNIDELNWIDNLLPELIWSGVIIEKLGIKRGVEVISFMSSTALELSKSDLRLNFSFISSYMYLEEDERENLILKLKEKDYYSDLQHSLEYFIYLYPLNNPLDFIIRGNNYINRKLAIEEFKSILEKYFDRRAEQAMLVQATAMYSLGKAGKLHILESVEPPDLNAIFTDFDSDNAKRSAGAVRNFVNIIFGFTSENFTNKWAVYFWNNGLNIEKVNFDIFSDTDYEYDGKDKFQSLVLEYQKKIDQTVIKIWNKLPKSIYENHTIEVIGSLLARQATIAKRIGRNLDLWDFHLGPVILRSMIDLHITLAWILKNPNQNAKKYIEYGLGQEKLQIEHLEDELDANNDKPMLSELIDARKAWLTSQRYSFLTTVNVGNWSGISTREMADESGSRNLYRFAYSPFSSCTHNMWNHVGKFNVEHSDNPLHKYIRLPIDPEFNPQFETLLNSAKYLGKLFNLVCRKFEIESDFDPILFWEDAFENMENSE